MGDPVGAEGRATGTGVALSRTCRRARRTPGVLRDQRGEPSRVHRPRVRAAQDRRRGDRPLARFLAGGWPPQAAPPHASHGPGRRCDIRGRSARVGRRRCSRELREVSDAWLAGKKTREKSFSLGRFDDDYLRLFPVGVVRAGGRVVAFANIWTGGHGRDVGGPDAIPSRGAVGRHGVSPARDDALGPHAGIRALQPRNGARCPAWRTASLRRCGIASAPSCSGTARTSTTSRDCGRTRRSSIRCGSRGILRRPADWRSPAC